MSKVLKEKFVNMLLCLFIFVDTTYKWMGGQVFFVVMAANKAFVVAEDLIKLFCPFSP